MANPNKQNIDTRPIIVGAYQLADKKTIAQDASGVIPAGAVLGIIKAGTVAAAVAGTNTGNGTVSAPAKAPGVKVGTYTIVFTAATFFHVIDPFGQVIGQGRTGVAFDTELAFTITAGGTPFAAGDSWTIAVAAGSGYLKRSDSTAVDGSQYPTHFVTDETDATGGNLTNVQCIKRADVREDGLVFTGSETLAAVVPDTGKTFRQLLEESGIYAVPGQVGSRYNNA